MAHTFDAKYRRRLMLMVRHCLAADVTMVTLVFQVRSLLCAIPAISRPLSEIASL
jgi:hypothetical protein